MTGIQTTTIAYVVLGVVACNRASTPDRSQFKDRVNTPRAGQEAHATDTTPAVSGQDTVLLETRQDTSRIVWQTNIGDRRVRRWVSGPTYSGTPMVEVRDLNGDGIPDLFWTLEREEIVAGMVLFGTAN